MATSGVILLILSVCGDSSAPVTTLIRARRFRSGQKARRDAH